MATQRPNGLSSDYAYNPAGHLRRVRHRAGSSLRGQFNYTVDGRGNRTRAFERLAQSTTVTATYNKSATQVTFTRGTWTDDGAYKKTTQFSGHMQIAYTGDEALLTIGTGPDHGMIDISINDNYWHSFNTYTAQPGERVIHLPQVPTPPGATSGVIEIRNRSDRHHRSTGYVFRFKQLVVINATYNERTIDYTYDGLSRLQQANYDGGTVEYTYGYDLAGNLTNMNGATRTYNATNQLTNDGTHTLTYDANGNLTNDGTNTYTWDRANRMLTAPNNTSYIYDGLGNRVSQTVNTTKTDYLLDLQPGLTKVIGDSDGNRYVHSPRGIHAMQTNAGEWSYTTQDGLGSVRSEIDSTLGVDTTHNYDPYGNYIGTAPTTAYFGFTGEQTDPTGQLYLRARYYHPSLGVFPSLDPFEGMASRPMSLNGYSWVEGNTPNMVDLSGKTATLANTLNSSLCSSAGTQQNDCSCWAFLRPLCPSLLPPCDAPQPPTPIPGPVATATGTPCCDNRSMVPVNVTYSACPDGPPRILSYDKECGRGSSSRDACGVQVYRKIAEQYGSNGCLTWSQILAVIYRKELGFLKPGNTVANSTFEPNQQTMWNLAKEAGARLLSQRVGSLTAPDVFGFICLLGTVESLYVNSNLGSANNYQSVTVDISGWEGFVGDANEALGQFSNGFEVGRPATWENIINPTLGILQSEFNFSSTKLDVANSDEVKQRLNRGYWPIAAIPGNAGSPYADAQGYLYITLTFDGGGSTGFSCIG